MNQDDYTAAWMIADRYAGDCRGHLTPEEQLLVCRALLHPPGLGEKAIPEIPEFLRRKTADLLPRPAPMVDALLARLPTLLPRTVQAMLYGLERQRAQLIELLVNAVATDQAAVFELAQLGMPADLYGEAMKQVRQRREELAKYRLTTLD